MIVFRLSKESFMHDLSGKGAEMAGGRWNSRGNPMLYTSKARALCMAETAVHFSYGNIPDDYYMIEIDVPDKGIVETIDEASLPKSWNGFPHTKATKEIGDSFLKSNKHLLLKVPSAVVPGDYNFLINPNHPDSGKIRIILF